MGVFSWLKGRKKDRRPSKCNAPSVEAVAYLHSRTGWERGNKKLGITERAFFCRCPQCGLRMVLHDMKMYVDIFYAGQSAETDAAKKEHCQRHDIEYSKAGTEMVHPNLYVDWEKFGILPEGAVAMRDRLTEHLTQVRAALLSTGDEVTIPPPIQKENLH